MIPLLQQDVCPSPLSSSFNSHPFQTSSLAESVKGYTVSPRSTCESSSGSIESPSPFPPSHLLGVIENAMEIVESTRTFLRANMSIMCGGKNG